MENVVEYDSGSESDKSTQKQCANATESVNVPTTRWVDDSDDDSASEENTPNSMAINKTSNESSSSVAGISASELFKSATDIPKYLENSHSSEELKAFVKVETKPKQQNKTTPSKSGSSIDMNENNKRFLELQAAQQASKPAAPTHKDKETAKDRVKRQRLSGQSGIGSDFREWRSEEEMRMRQHYDT